MSGLTERIRATTAGLEGRIADVSIAVYRQLGTARSLADSLGSSVFGIEPGQVLTDEESAALLECTRVAAFLSMLDAGMAAQAAEASAGPTAA